MRVSERPSAATADGPPRFVLAAAGDFGEHAHVHQPRRTLDGDARCDRHV